MIVKNIKNSDRMSLYHPFISTLYFAVVIGVLVIKFHPFALGIAFAGAVIYRGQLFGITNSLIFAAASFPATLLITAVNIFFNHRGETILFYLNRNPITLESLVYGFALGFMLQTTMIWFSCVHAVLTKDRLLTALSKLNSNIALLVSMTMRFIPLYKNKYKEIKLAQKELGNLKKAGLIKNLIVTVRCISILITWSLENAVETANSMKARGFGTGIRTSYTPYVFAKRDKTMLIFLIILLSAIIFFAAKSRVMFSPWIYIGLTWRELSFALFYLIFTIIPIIININIKIRRNLTCSR